MKERLEQGCKQEMEDLRYTLQAKKEEVVFVCRSWGVCYCKHWITVGLLEFNAMIILYLKMKQKLELAHQQEMAEIKSTLLTEKDKVPCGTVHVSLMGTLDLEIFAVDKFLSGMYNDKN